MIMKTEGKGFTFFLDEIKLRDFDEFESKVKKIEVKIEVKNLEIHAKRV